MTPDFLDVPLAWVATWAIHAAIATFLLLAIGWCGGARLLARPGVWRFALLSALSTATLQLLVAPTWLDFTVWAPAAPGAPVGTFDADAVPAADLTTPAPAASAGTNWIDELPLVFAACAVALATLGVLGLLRSRAALRALLASRQPVDDPRVLAMAGAVAGQLGLRQTPQLSRCEALATPVAFGFVRPEICLPARVAGLDDEALRALLAHELAHLRHGDAGWLWAGAWLQAVFPWHPAVRIARRRLYDATELRCDAIAASCASPLAVANCLLEVATWLRPPMTAPRGVLAMAARPSALRVRVEAALRGERVATWPRGWCGAAMALATGAQVLVLPGVAITDPPVAEPRDAWSSTGDANELFAGLATEYARLQAEALQLRQELASSADPALRAMLTELELRVARLAAAQRRLRDLAVMTAEEPLVSDPERRSSR